MTHAYLQLHIGLVQAAINRVDVTKPHTAESDRALEDLALRAAVLCEVAGELRLQSHENRLRRDATT